MGCELNAPVGSEDTTMLPLALVSLFVYAFEILPQHNTQEKNLHWIERYRSNLP